MSRTPNSIHTAHCNTTIVVRSYDLDSFGHVNNAVYLNYLEAARCDFLEKYGIRFDEFAEREALPVLVRAEIDFRAPAKCHDQLNIATTVDQWRSRTFTMSYRITKQNNGSVICSARTVHVFIDTQGNAIAIPDWFREAFATDE